MHILQQKTNVPSAAINSLWISLKMQLMWLYFLLGKQFEDSLEKEILQQ